MKFEYKGNRYIFYTCDSVLSPVVSSNTMVSNVDEKNELFVVLLRLIHSGKSRAQLYSRDVQKTFKIFSDVFKEKLPRGFPPRRKHEFEIELQEGEKPQKKGVYRVSDKEMSKL